MQAPELGLIEARATYDLPFLFRKHLQKKI